MVEKTTINVDANLIANNIQELSLVGSTFCGNYYKPAKEQCDKNFAQKTIEASTTGALWLNRGVQRIKVSGVPVIKLEYGQISDGSDHMKPVVYINKDMKKTVGDQEFDQSVTIPVGMGQNIFSDNSDDQAFADALKGEKRIFAIPNEAVRRANALNETYLAEVRALKKYLADQETLLVNTINSNNNVVKRYMEMKAKIVTPKEVVVTIDED